MDLVRDGAAGDGRRSAGRRPRAAPGAPDGPGAEGDETAMGQQVVFAHEAKERLRVAVLGTSGHAFRNYLPVLPFIPVEYVAHWDPDLGRARAFARQFGAPGGADAAYDDVDALLEAHRPQAVWIATE